MMQRFRPRLRTAIAGAIAIVPTNRARRTLYRKLLGYSIAPSAHIASCVLLDVDHADLGPGTKIGRFNRISGPFRIRLAQRATLGGRNTIVCGAYAADAKRQSHGYQRRCDFGVDSLVTTHHFIDTAGGFTLGDRSWLAGRGTQVWTHGAGDVGEVTIGQDVYVGAGTRFAPGTVVPNDCIVGMGAVLRGTYDEQRCLLAGVPARVVRRDVVSPWSKHRNHCGK